uniref:Uncharacterized protein n=1 Tax=Knipowitschia caucasica TaxID=637954 RepID=A0AAV2KDI1_KNICA
MRLQHVVCGARSIPFTIISSSSRLTTRHNGPMALCPIPRDRVTPVGVSAEARLERVEEQERVRHRRALTQAQAE